MQKILEIKNIDWMKGISSQPNVAVGGLFQHFNGCDPFEVGGLGMPSLLPDNQTLGSIPKFLTSVYDNVTADLHINVLSATKLYQVLKDSSYTVTDKTSQINQNLSAGTAINQNGATYWKNRYIYVTYTNGGTFYDICSNRATPSAGNDVKLYSMVPDTTETDSFYFGVSNPGNFTFRFCQGADGNLYFSLPGGVGELTSATGASGTLFKTDPGYITRDVLSDGRYLIIIADNNAVNDSDKVVGDFNCRIYFWDMVQTDGSGRIVADAIWDVKDSYVIGARFLENAVYFITYSGLYVCNVGTSPKLIRLFPTDITALGRPANAYQIGGNKGSIFWVNGGNPIYHYIYAYGNPITGQPKIFYQPYQQNVGDFTNTCLAVAGTELIMGTDQPGLFFFNGGSTRGTVNVKSLDTNMPQPYTYGFTKVVLGQKLAAGQSVQVIAYGNGGNDLISTETKSFSTVGAKQTLKFDRVVASPNQPEKFEDITINVTSGAPLQRVATYAAPIDDANTDL